MPENWKKYRLGDLIEVNKRSIRKGDLDWINYIDIKSVGTGFYEEPKRMNFEDAPSRARRLLKEGDTVISSVRPNLKSYFYSQNLKENTIASTGFAVLTPKNIDKRFLYYLTTNDNYINYLVQSCTGSAYPAFGPQVLLDSEVLIPESFQEQKSIASILSALDDKIELNLQMHKTLEEMAMALYKHWFVDFGPFQDEEFVATELGEIPEGWEVKKLPEISKNHNKKRKPLSTRVRANRQGKYPYYGATKILDYIDEYKFDGEYILLAEDGTVKTERDTPFLQFVEGKFWVSNHAHVLSGTRAYSNEFLYLCLNNKNVIPIITGAVQLKINKQNLESLEFVVPPLNSLKLFEEIIIPLFQQQKFIVKENQTLTQLRDTLLPKLISGEVRVKDVEKTLSEVL